MKKGSFLQHRPYLDLHGSRKSLQNLEIFANFDTLLPTFFSCADVCCFVSEIILDSGQHSTLKVLVIEQNSLSRAVKCVGPAVAYQNFRTVFCVVRCPNKFNPFNDRALAMKRAKTVLTRMVHEGFIEKHQKGHALNSELDLEKKRTKYIRFGM